jgi:NADH-quinone oxidoreductase subunit I
LVVDDDGLPQRQPWELWHDGDDSDTSGWMRATASSGNPDYQNRIAWSGELGYGVRAPEIGQRASNVEDEAEGPEGQHRSADARGQQ